MSDVEFNPDGGGGFDFRSGARGVAGPTVGWITKLTMKLSGIQDEQKANQALLIVAIVIFIISGFIFWSYL